jgi:hypothetical protein
MKTDNTAVKIARWILFSITLPWTLVVGYGWILLFTCLFAAHNWRMEEYGILTAEWRPWAAKIWRYSTTLGRGIIYQPGLRRADPNAPFGHTERHERVHVNQVEDLMVLGLVLGIVVVAGSGDWLLGFLLWATSGAWQLPNFLTGWMRGGDPYRDSEHERSAYGQVD